jgi:glyoxylase-like metal-dependent hydrolase (beta-lactamase superfamily II)
MTSTEYQEAHHRDAVDKLLAPRLGGPASKASSSNRLLGSLKEAASWPGADRNTVVTLALSLVAARADAEGSSYFQNLSERNPADATAQALAGFFQVRARHGLAAAVTKLDKAATMEPGLPQYFRGLALADLLPGEGPSGTELAAADTARADQVVADLEFVLAARDQFPVLLLRAAHQGLARAYQVLGRQQDAAEALRRSGLGSAAADRQPMFTSFSVTARDGMRLSAPRALSPAPDVHVAQSYDFGDFAFIKTSTGVVALDAGTSPDRVLSAMADLGLKDQAPVSHLILTHAHFDHIGGAAAVRGPDTEVIASAEFPAEAERLRDYVPRELIGTRASPGSDVEPDRLISERTSLVVGDTEFVLIPVRGGETPDALMVYLPATGVLFTGDVMMPYLGVPFFAEGSPEGLLETLRYIRELAPRQLIEGHTTLTENFTIEAVAGLEPALTQLHEFAVARIGQNMPLAHILDIGYLPASLRDHPAAVVPYLVSRDTLIARLYHQRTGYWQPDGQGLDPRSQEERAAALDLLAGENAEAFVTTAATLAGHGDLALALEILNPGLLRHPDSSELAELRQAVLLRLMEQRQLLDPFGFLVYAGLAGAELSPAAIC